MREEEPSSLKKSFLEDFKSSRTQRPLIQSIAVVACQAGGCRRAIGVWRAANGERVRR